MARRRRPTNIEKHALARNVLLHIGRQDGQVFLHIADDGVGLLPGLCQLTADEPEHNTSPAGHDGLNGIQERVRHARGHLVTGRHGEQGTPIEVALPLVAGERIHHGSTRTRAFHTHASPRSSAARFADR